MLGDQAMSELTLRLGAFVLVLLAMALLELAAPRRRLVQSKLSRWVTNLGMAGLNSLVLKAMAALAVPLSAMAAAIYAQAQGWGLLNSIGLPTWLEISAAIVVLDGAIYLQHVASHKIPMLWRLHRVHHADRDFDVTTGIRFHPVEIALSMLYKIVLVVLIGPAPVAVLLFEVILNSCALFNHANLALPRWLDAPLRLILVTPDMHRVHHSVLRREHDTNYGFNLSIWDRLFGTYTSQPEGGHTAMTIGLNEFQTDAPGRLSWSLMLPFRPMAGRAPRVSDQKTLSGK